MVSFEKVSQTVYDVNSEAMVDLEKKIDSNLLKQWSGSPTYTMAISPRFPIREIVLSEICRKYETAGWSRVSWKRVADQRDGDFIEFTFQSMGLKR